MAMLLFVMALTEQNRVVLNKPDLFANNLKISDLTPYTTNFVMFYSKLLAGHTKALVQVPFAFDENNQTPVLYVGYTPLDPDARRDVLISHPLMENLGWQKIVEGDFSLYQREAKFKSIGDLLTNLPEKGLAVDTYAEVVFDELEFQHHLNDMPNLEEIDYILTSYKAAELRNGVRYFKSEIDIEPASINEQNQIEWYVRAPNPDMENPYLIGPINVEYL